MLSTDFLDIPPLSGANGVVCLPGSKSISNRALLLAALSQGTTILHDLLESDDTAVMLTALRQLGCNIVQIGSTVEVTGLGGELLIREGHLFMGNAGTAMRPLTAAIALMGGEFELSGVKRMHERPIGDLVDALRQIGCGIDYLADDGFPPLRLIGRTNSILKLGSPLLVRGDVSSQFLTSMLMALPLVAKQDIHIEVVGELISKPYIEITLKLMQLFGVHVQREKWRRFTIAAGSRYQSPNEMHIEADASSASYFIALGAINTSTNPSNAIEIQGVGQDSIQGDIRFVEAARLMGAHIDSAANTLHISRGGVEPGVPLTAIDLDCNHIPDAAMTLAVMALYAKGTTTLRNIASWRVKETDRIAAMACELRKLGARIEEGADFISITPPSSTAEWKTAPIHTYDDHRMAMCFSLAAFNPAKLPIRILDPKCVAKTFPNYFEVLFGLVQAETHDIPVICVDGPTASGKGTLAAEVAQKLGYHYLDSGALYRLTAFAALQRGVLLNDGPRVAQVAERLQIQFEGAQVLLNGDDVTEHIRTEESGTAASKVSVHPEVRTALLALQRSFRKLPGLVADGRDMATVVFPDAALKIYLTADAQHRAVRRHKQLISKGNTATLEAVLQTLEARDARDSSRTAAPLKTAENALLLDNSELSIEKSVTQVLDWWQSTRPF